MENLIKTNQAKKNWLAVLSLAQLSPSLFYLFPEEKYIVLGKSIFILVYTVFIHEIESKKRFL